MQPSGTPSKPDLNQFLHKEEAKTIITYNLEN